MDDPEISNESNSNEENDFNNLWKILKEKNNYK
jgi:hypothetical protein